MSILLDSTAYTIPEQISPVAFEHVGQPNSSAFDRHLTIDGKSAYDLSISCDTCAFLFERLEGANQSVSSEAISDTLRSGITTLTADVVQQLALLMPKGQYRVHLLELTPRLISPGQPDDYFVTEQVDLWGIDSFWGLPHYPKTAYYRTPARPLGNNRAVFEFVIPLIPKGWLDEDTINVYSARLQQGERPTALAISILDVKQPATWEGNPTIMEHWCFAHFLLDGHHKVYAAAERNAPLNLISFLAVEESIATPAELEELIRGLH